MGVWILFTMLGLCLADDDSRPYISSDQMYDWSTSLYPCINGDTAVSFVKSGKMILRVCSVESTENGEKVFVTHIKSAYPGDETISCKIPNSRVFQAENIEDGRIVMSSNDTVYIVDVAKCNHTEIKIEVGSIIPFERSFIVISSGKKCGEVSTCAIKYDDAGNIVEKYDNIPQSKNATNQFILLENSQGPSAYVNVQNLTEKCSRKNCNRTTIDVFNSTFHKLDSQSMPYEFKAYSAAHDNFTACFMKEKRYDERELTCRLYDRNMRPYHSENTGGIYFSSRSKFVSVQNLVGGGAMIIFCDMETETTCRLGYKLMNVNGRITESEAIDSSYHTRNDSSIHQIIDPAYSPKILELNAEKRTYCIMMPQSPWLNVQCIRVKIYYG